MILEWIFFYQFSDTRSDYLILIGESRILSLCPEYTSVDIVLKRYYIRDMIPKLIYVSKSFIGSSSEDFVVIGRFVSIDIKYFIFTYLTRIYFTDDISKTFFENSHSSIVSIERCEIGTIYN